MSDRALDGPPTLQGTGEATPDLDPDRGSRPRSRIVAGIGAVLLLSVGWLVFGRNDDAAELNAGAGDSVPVATEVEDSLPSTVDESADAEPDDVADDDDEAGAASADAQTIGNGWRKDTVELPQVLLDSTVAFQLLALTSMGDYLEVTVPAGTVDLVEIGRGIDGRVVAGETSTLFVSYSTTQGGRLLRAGEPPLELSLPSNVDISQVGVSGDEFAGYAYGNNGEQSLVRILPDGGVVTTEVSAGEFNIWQRSFTPDGSTLLSEAGGVYVGGADGFERISTGYLISASTNHILVRECDELMACGYATIEFESGERVEAVIADDALGRFGFDSAQVSPDGRWLRYATFGSSSSDEVLIDLTTGVRTELDFANLGQQGSVWAADSTGFFRTSLELGFEFYVVATGETIRFGEEFGRVSSFDIRTVPGLPGRPGRALTTTGVSLIALTESGDVAQIDVDSGAVVTTDGPGMESSASVTVFPDPAGATFASYDSVPSVRFNAEERTAVAVAGSGPDGPLWPGPEPGTVWQTGADAGALSLELVDAQGNDLDARIDFDAVGVNGIVGSDGRGGVVIEPELGGVFALDAANPPERITSGELLAVNASVAYVRECDDALQCGVFVVDRVNGARTMVDNTGLSRAGDIVSRGVPSGQNVSPDGAIAFVRDGNDPTRCLMIDTTAGRGSWTGVPCVDVASPVVWTPGSEYAIWLDHGRVTIYERSTRSVRVLNAVELKAMAVVPTDAVPVDGVAQTPTPDDAPAS